jgi:hypothetical protein
MRCLAATASLLVACASSVGVDRRDAATADAVTAPDRPSAPCVAPSEEACSCPDGFAHVRRCGADGVFGECSCASEVRQLTYDYVVTRRLLDDGSEASTTARARYGFNLDGRFSTRDAARQEAADCAHGDDFSAVDPDQDRGACSVGAVAGGPDCRGGVDNQLPTIMRVLRQFEPSSDPQARLDAELAAGRSITLIRVASVDAPVGPTLEDNSVRVFIYDRAWATSADCADVARPDRRYVVDDRSLAVPGDLSSARWQFAGRIVHGRLDIIAGADAVLPLPIPLTGAPTAFEARGPRLRLTLGEVEATDGNLGGSVRPDELADALVEQLITPLPGAARPLFRGFVDVATGAPTAACESPAGAVGVGLGFRALRAVIAPTTVAAPPAGACGSR